MADQVGPGAGTAVQIITCFGHLSLETASLNLPIYDQTSSSQAIHTSTSLYPVHMYGMVRQYRCPKVAGMPILFIVGLERLDLSRVKVAIQ